MASRCCDRAVTPDEINTLRPELHRYCARLMGSIVDGEDIANVLDQLAGIKVDDGPDVDEIGARCRDLGGQGLVLRSFRVEGLEAGD